MAASRHSFGQSWVKCALDVGLLPLAVIRKSVQLLILRKYDLTKIKPQYLLLVLNLNKSIIY